MQVEQLGALARSAEIVVRDRFGSQARRGPEKGSTDSSLKPGDSR